MVKFHEKVIAASLVLLGAFTMPANAAPPALTGLALSSGTLSPSFSGAITNYTLLLAPNTASLSITPTGAGSTITVADVAVASGSSISLTLATGQKSISIVSTASGASATYTLNIAHNVGLIPTLSGKITTDGVLTFSITNYDSNYSWSASSTAGTATIDSTGNVRVTGIPQGTAATVTVTTSRDDYTSKSTTILSDVIPIVTKAASTPTFSTPVPSASGFTVNFTNYDSAFNLVIKTNIGQVTSGSASGSTLPLTVTGLTTGQSATITITTSRSGYYNGTGTIVGSSTAGAGLAPTFSAVNPSNTGLTLSVTNYNSAYTYNVTTSSGTIAKGVASGSNLPLTVSGLIAGQNATVTVSTVRTGYSTVSATTSGTASTGGAFNPTFGTPVSNTSGFSANMTNYDSKFTYTASSTAGTATINNAGTVTVSGLTPGASATVTVTTSRTGYLSGSGSVTGSPLTGTALNPAIGSQTITPTGVSFQVSNYDPKFTWAVSTTLGSATIGSTGLIALTGLTPGSSFSITVTTTRTGFNNGTATKNVTTPVGAALNPVFGVVTPITNGITVQINNYDSAYQWNLSVTSGNATVDQAGLITVINLSPGSATSVSVKTSRTGYNSGSGNVRGNALAYVAPVPTATKKPQVLPQKSTGPAKATKTTKPISSVKPKFTPKPVKPSKNKPVAPKKSGKMTAKIITCSNGTTTKRIVGYNPRCPSGFVQKG